MKKFYFPNDGFVDNFFNDGDPICFDEKELDRLCAEWGEEIRGQVHEASLAEIDRYGTYEHEEEAEPKTIYTVMDSPRKGDGDVWEDHPTFDRDEAVANAETALRYLTRRERAKRKIEVISQEVQVFPGETAQGVMDRLIDADEWGTLCNAEEITEG